MENEIAGALYENVLEKLVMTYVKTLNREDLLSMIECESIKLLSRILEILEDDTLDDPQCFRRIDEIAGAFTDKGIYTSRHDW